MQYPSYNDPYGTSTSSYAVFPSPAWVDGYHSASYENTLDPIYYMQAAGCQYSWDHHLSLLPQQSWSASTYQYSYQEAAISSSMVTHTSPRQLSKLVHEPHIVSVTPLVNARLPVDQTPRSASSSTEMSSGCAMFHTNAQLGPVKRIVVEEQSHTPRFLSVEAGSSRKRSECGKVTYTHSTLGSQNAIESPSSASFNHIESSPNLQQIADPARDGQRQ